VPAIGLLEDENEAKGNEHQHNDDDHESMLKVVFNLWLTQDPAANVVTTCVATFSFIPTWFAAVWAPAIVVVFIAKTIEVVIRRPVVVVMPSHGRLRHGDLGTRCGRLFDHRRTSNCECKFA
jgi:hypothetical protein